MSRQSGRRSYRPDEAGSHKKRKIYHVVDPQNKEGVVAVAWFRERWKGGLFFMGFQNAFLELAQKPVRGEAARILFFILGTMDYSNEVKTSQAEIARRLGIRRQNVYRAVRVLVEKEILLEDTDPDTGRRRLKLNHTYAWKGKLKKLGFKEKAGQQRGAEEKTTTSGRSKQSPAPLPPEEKNGSR